MTLTLIRDHQGTSKQKLERQLSHRFLNRYGLNVVCCWNLLVLIFISSRPINIEERVADLRMPPNPKSLPPPPPHPPKKPQKTKNLNSCLRSGNYFFRTWHGDANHYSLHFDATLNDFHLIQDHSCMRNKELLSSFYLKYLIRVGRNCDMLP